MHKNRLQGYTFWKGGSFYGTFDIYKYLRKPFIKSNVCWRPWKNCRSIEKISYIFVLENTYTESLIDRYKKTNENLARKS